nr:efflux transporter outer membrane subunit [Ideonella sp. A 288]
MRSDEPMSSTSQAPCVLRWVLGVLSVAMLGACASPAPPASTAVPAPDLPPAWSRAPSADHSPVTPAAQGRAEPSADWWRLHQDPLLSALVDEALAANADLRRARAALAQARALRDVAAAGQSLQLGGSASASRNRSAGSSANSLRAGLDASWEADLFGANASATAAAQAQADASAASLAAVRQSVAAEVGLAYLQWMGTRQQLAIAEAGLASQAETRQLAQWRLQAGLATVLDTAQADSTVEQTRARLAALRTTQAQTGHRLSVLLGQAPGALSARLAAAAQSPTLPPLPSVGLPADLLRRRPDLVAAEWRVQAAAATLAQREAERLPRVDLGGTLALAARTLSGLTTGGAVAASLAASVNWPLLDGGAARARAGAQAAALDGARADYEAAVLVALQDVEDALAALDHGRAQEASLVAAAAAAREVQALDTLRHRAGLVDVATLLEAQRTALSADEALASARNSLAQQQIRLYKALGGGWPAEPAP